MNTSYREAHTEWLELEELKACAPAADRRCRKCGEASMEALCADCDRRRLDGLRRFGGRVGYTPVRRRRSETPGRSEWLPYRD